jgi:hypothetical protein
MKTFEEQKEFFQANWPAMKEAVESGGGRAAVEYIKAIEDPLERRVLFVFARMGLVMDEWEGKNFDPYIDVVDSGIAEMLTQAREAEDEESRAARINGAHVLSYNLAADLADCWPGDEEARTEAHFERGLKAAEDCLGWCNPSIVQGLAQDWWVRGMHQLSLGKVAGCEASWEKAFEYSQQVAEADGMPTEVSPDAGFGVILGSGYVGLIKAIREKPEGFQRFEEALGAFTTQMGDENLRDDAAFGIAQLQTVQGKYLKTTPPNLNPNAGEATA